MSTSKPYLIKPATGGGYGLTRDDLALRTPQKEPLVVPTKALAEAIAQEIATVKKFTLTQMPLTAIAFTAIDVARPHADKMVAAMLTFAETDLLLFRSEVAELANRQKDGWDPVLGWVEKRYGCTLLTTDGIMPLTQPEESIQKFEQALAGFDAFTMAAFSVLTQSLSSLMLALLVKEQQAEAEEAFRLSRLEEEFQTQKWGEDTIAVARAREIERDALAAAKCLELLAA